MFNPTGSTNEEAKGGEESSRIKTALAPSIFLQALQSSAEMKNFSEFTDFIKTLAPSSLDMELRILQIVGDEDEEEPEKLLPIELLFDYFIHETACRNNFDFVQAVIRVFLKIHGETIRRQSRLQDKASKLLDVQCNT